MANASDTQKAFLQNLQDAGCAPDMIETCMALAQDRKTTILLRQLSQQKGTLLEKVHMHQREIDCLDYLIYRIDRNEY